MHLARTACWIGPVSTACIRAPHVAWVVIPFLLVSGLAGYGWKVLADEEAVHPHELHVKVIGQQFAWHYTYPDAPGGKPVTSDRLEIPNHKQVIFKVHALDVLHDFWVPAFRMKIDAVPGITTEVKMTPKKLGDFPVVCAELCGYGHALMRSTVHVVSQSQFDAWLAKQSGSSQ